MDLPLIAICPLCSFESHVGHCPKLPPGKWWCAVCLLSKIPAPSPTDPKIVVAVLVAAQVQRTHRWCRRCGASVCSDHLEPTTRPYPSGRCAGDCRRRTPAEVAALRAILEVYVPDFLTAIPRCVVCGDPAYRKGLCQRHHEHVRSGRRVLPVERYRRYRSAPLRATTVYLDPEVHARAAVLAAQGGVTFNRWAAKILTEAAGLPEPVNTYDVRGVADSAPKHEPD